MDATRIMNIKVSVILALGLLLTGCGPVPMPEVSEPEAARDVGAESQQLRRAVTNMESFLSELEGRLKGASTNNWSENASAAQHIAGNIRIELEKMKPGL